MSATRDGRRAPSGGAAWPARRRARRRGRARAVHGPRGPASVPPPRVCRPRRPESARARAAASRPAAARASSRRAGPCRTRPPPRARVVLRVERARERVASGDARAAARRGRGCPGRGPTAPARCCRASTPVTMHGCSLSIADTQSWAARLQRGGLRATSDSLRERALLQSFITRHALDAGTGALVLSLELLAIVRAAVQQQWHWGISSQSCAFAGRDARKSIASMRAARLLRLPPLRALNPSATTRRQLAGIAGGGLALVAAPPARADVRAIPPATTKMGGLLEKYGGRRPRRRKPAGPARRRRRLAVDAS